MTLHLHTAERTDALADGLADLLVTPLPDPFAREVVVVPARGVERWLTQRLSHRLGVGARGGDGVCAGVDFVTPHSLVSMLLDRDAEDPWSPDRLAWPLLEVVDDVMGTAGFEDLTAHLGGGDPTDELKGKAKEAKGKATDDEQVEADGRTDQAGANLKQAGEKVKDAFKG